MSKGTLSRPALLIRAEYETFFAVLTDAERGKLLSALMAYQWRGEQPTKLSEKLSGVFLVLKSFADADAEAYKDTCEERRKAALIRWENERRQRGQE